MKLFLLSATSLLLLTSCSTYAYLTLNSDEVQKKNEKKEFVWENDTLSITYNFNGEDGPMKIKVYNKTDQPLYIYWKKSALIFNENSISLYNRTVNISGAISTYSGNRRLSTGSSFSTLNASFDLPEGMDFVPPKTYFNKELLNVQQTNIPDLKTMSNIPLQKIKTSQEYTIKLRRALYNQSQSPVRFKTYLTFILGHNAVEEFSIEHSFYVAEILQVNDEPETSSLYGLNGDKFYSRVRDKIEKQGWGR